MEERTLGHESVVARLAELDSDLEPLTTSGRTLDIIIVGGAALMLDGLADPARLTAGIDCLEVPFEAMGFMRGLDMNNAVATFAFRMPSGWRDRLEEIDLGLGTLRVLAPSPPDLVIMKLLSGRDRDTEDIAAMMARDPGLANRTSEILSDPLEVMVNVDAEDWEAITARARDHGIDPDGRSSGGGSDELSSRFVVPTLGGGGIGFGAARGDRCR